MSRPAGAPRRHNLPAYLTAGSAAALVLAWWLVTEVGSVPAYVIPRPAAVIRALVYGSTIGIARVDYLSQLWVTVQATLIGFGIGTVVGVLLGAVLGELPGLDEAIHPYLSAIQSLPKLALVPLLLVWMGIGQPPKVATAALVAFFPVLINTMVGLQAVEPELLELMRALNASRMRVFVAVRFPSALPLILTGMEMAIAYALVGVMLTEFLAADSGAGLIIRDGQNTMSTAAVFAMLLLLSALGLVFQWTIRWVRSKVVFWAKRIELAVT